MLCDWLWYNYICLPIKRCNFVDDNIEYQQNNNNNINNQNLLNIFFFTLCK